MQHLQKSQFDYYGCAPHSDHYGSPLVQALVLQDFFPVKQETSYFKEGNRHGGNFLKLWVLLSNPDQEQTEVTRKQQRINPSSAHNVLYLHTN